jgi:hypothetical protein
MILPPDQARIESGQDPLGYRELIQNIPQDFRSKGWVRPGEPAQFPHAVGHFRVEGRPQGIELFQGGATHRLEQGMDSEEFLIKVVGAPVRKLQQSVLHHL